MTAVISQDPRVLNECAEVTCCRELESFPTELSYFRRETVAGSLSQTNSGIEPLPCLSSYPAKVIMVAAMDV